MYESLPCYDQTPDFYQCITRPVISTPNAGTTQVGVTIPVSDILYKHLQIVPLHVLSVYHLCYLDIFS